MKVLKVGYLTSAALLVLCVFVFILMQATENVRFFHPDTGQTAIFEVGCIVYNLCILVLISVMAARVCGCPPTRSSITFILLTTLSVFVSIVCLGLLIASVVSKPESFPKVGLFCLICLLQTLLLPTITYLADDGSEQIRKPSSQLQAGMMSRMDSRRASLPRPSALESLRTLLYPSFSAILP
ncbi:hypothetical protein M3Y99_00836500 [Aphelenchoides fujianensis]|nr:hypothetical protein M3Y99_00836500 [Aphelenchoides fujianensis]